MIIPRPTVAEALPGRERQAELDEPLVHERVPRFHREGCGVVVGGLKGGDNPAACQEHPLRLPDRVQLERPALVPLKPLRQLDAPREGLVDKRGVRSVAAPVCAPEPEQRPRHQQLPPVPPVQLLRRDPKMVADLAGPRSEADPAALLGEPP